MPFSQANIDVFRRCMPVAIRSANFLSGGQSLEDASARLSVMNQVRRQTLPLRLGKAHKPGCGSPQLA